MIKKVGPKLEIISKSWPLHSIGKINYKSCTRMCCHICCGTDPHFLIRRGVFTGSFKDMGSLSTPRIKNLGCRSQVARRSAKQLKWQAPGAKQRLSFKCWWWYRPLLPRCGHQGVMCEGCAEEGVRPTDFTKIFSQKFFFKRSPREHPYPFRRANRGVRTNYH